MTGSIQAEHRILTRPQVELFEKDLTSCTDLCYYNPVTIKKAFFYAQNRERIPEKQKEKTSERIMENGGGKRACKDYIGMH